MTIIAASPLSAIATALYAALNVDDLLALAPGGVHDDVPQAPTFPFVLLDLQATFTGGLGTTWSRGNGCWELPLRLHIYSQYEGWQEAQHILSGIVTLMDAGLPMDGSDYTVSATFNDDAIQLPDQLIAGVKCKELVLNARIYAEVAP